MPKLTLFVAIHGILTGRTNPTWPERFEIWAASRICRLSVLTDHYRAGPIPLLNVGWRNPRAAKAIAAVVENWLEGHAGEVDVHFVGHSNGCDIARRAAIRLMARGYRVNSLQMFCPPTRASMAGMNLQRYVDNGQLLRTVVYAAGDDEVLAPAADWRRPWTIARRIIRWPYGNAGRVGLSDGEQSMTGSRPTIWARTATRHYPGWGHSDFFPLANPGRMTATFETILRDAEVETK